MITRTTQDGGTVTSRFLRLTAADVYAFLLTLQGKQLEMDLKDIIVPLMHLQLNGEHFMNLSESYLREQVKMQMPQIIKILTLVSWIQSGYDYDSLKQVLKEKDDKLKEKEREKEKEKDKDKDKDKKNKRSSSKTNPNSNDDTLDRLEVLTLIEHIWYKERKSPPTEPCYHLLPQHLFDVRKTRGVPKGPNKPVLEWDNSDCLQWLETMKANDKLMRSFRETKVTGKDILNITQWSLENVFGISHKSHIKLVVQG
ncbi:RhoGAP domain-containing protein, partial [Reticulomyxa filosa]